MHKQAKFSKPMVTLAVITLVLSSYGLFELAHVYGAMPTPLAVLAVAGFDLTAIAAGNHAMTVADDGDSSGVWNLLVVAAAVTSAVLQYAHTQLAGQSWAIGVLMAAFPIATVLLFEGTLRRAHRLNGRLTGRVAEPRATFELLQWVVYPAATWWAFRRSIADRSLGGSAAFLLGIQATTPAQLEHKPAGERREFVWDYSRPDGGQIREVTGGQSADAPESADPTPDPRPVTELVREFLQVRGVDKAGQELALDDVLRVKPDANPESVRRTIRRETGLRSA